MIQCATLRIPKGMKKKCNFHFYSFCLDFFIRNENVTSEECKTKKPFEIILHVGRVTSLQSWVAKKSCHGQTLQKNVLLLTTLPILKACNSPYMQYYFKRFFCFAFLRSYIFISDRKVKAKSKKKETTFFHPLGNPKGRTLDHFFYASHICHNFPYKLIPISMS